MPCLVLLTDEYKCTCSGTLATLGKPAEVFSLVPLPPPLPYTPCCFLCCQYAHWEESQKDFRRARSIWERALDADYTNTNFWLKVGWGCSRECCNSVECLSACLVPLAR